MIKQENIILKNGNKIIVKTENGNLTVYNNITNRKTLQIDKKLSDYKCNAEFKKFISIIKSTIDN